MYTFHFPCGEYIVTPLESMAITGLRFNEDVIHFNYALSLGIYRLEVILKLLGIGSDQKVILANDLYKH